MALSINDKVLELEKIIQQDPGKRGLDSWAISGHILPAMKSLMNANHIYILTGFYILSAGAVETDGPPGVASLAFALERLGKKVTVFTDWHAQAIIKASLVQAGVNAELKVYKPSNLPSVDKLLTDDVTHVIALERPGRALNGKYHNFRGHDISDFVVGYDDVFIEAANRGLVTIGIGDGGNELGMGNVSEAINLIAPHENFSCFVKSTFCICAGVSNWAGYGCAALLSLLSDKKALFSIDKMLSVLKAGVDNGAVDGVSSKPEMSVDGLELEWEKKVFRDLSNLLK